MPTKFLSRSSIRLVKDRATGSVSLRYDGRGLHWFDRLYGFPDGVFFAVLPEEIPLPESLEKTAHSLGLSLITHPKLPELKERVAEALAAEATVEAPDLLKRMAKPETAWYDHERREVERRHLVALTRVAECVKQIEADLRLRSALMSPVSPVPVASRSEVEPVRYEPDEIALPSPEPAKHVEPPAVVERATEAIRRAREAELPQRLPGGARRKLGKMESGVYIITGDDYARKEDLCAAMSDAQDSSRRRSHEVAIVDWDGEWPVVVRRYAERGRIVYRVEDALRRAGIEEEAA